MFTFQIAVLITVWQENYCRRLPLNMDYTGRNGAIRIQLYACERGGKKANGVAGWTKRRLSNSWRLVLHGRMILSYLP